MQLDEQSVEWLCDTAVRHLGRNRIVESESRGDGIRLLTFAPRQPIGGTESYGVIWMELRAYVNPFREPELDEIIEDDAPIDETTGDPIPTVYVQKYPPLFCFCVQNYDLYRATMSRSPEIITCLLDEMEAELAELNASDEQE